MVILYKKYNYEYNNKKAIMIANNPIASVKAKPNKANCINLPSLDGFLLIANNNPENTIPIPAPAPTTPIVAKPAPIYLALVVKVKKKKFVISNF
jgi:hypothetical protein